LALPVTKEIFWAALFLFSYHRINLGQPKLEARPASFLTFTFLIIYTIFNAYRCRGATLVAGQPGTAWGDLSSLK